MAQRATAMKNLAKALGARARELSPFDRIALVEEVLDSLDRTDSRVDELWATEAKDRLAAYRRGEIAARDLNEIIAKYRP
jgi:putative addiction module component (TIGR02574 family)